jgi:hypothetical protein
MALAHSVGSEVERAYRRTDMLEKRRAMMEAWAGVWRADSLSKTPSDADDVIGSAMMPH